MHSLPHLHTPAHILTHTLAHPHTLHTYPLMPANALNLIICMKLHVNGKMVEREIDREIEKRRNKSPLRQSMD